MGRFENNFGSHTECFEDGWTGDVRFIFTERGEMSFIACLARGWVAVVAVHLVVAPVVGAEQQTDSDQSVETVESDGSLANDALALDANDQTPSANAEQDPDVSVSSDEESESLPAPSDGQPTGSPSEDVNQNDHDPSQEGSSSVEPQSELSVDITASPVEDFNALHRDHHESILTPAGSDDPIPSTQPSPVIRPKILRANCGPILLQKVFEKYGLNATVSQLVKQSNTRYGLTSLYEMKRVVIDHGLYAEGVKTDLSTLEKLVQQGMDVVCHYTGNNHYVWVQSIDDRVVTYLDPAWLELNGGLKALRRSSFDRQWEGICLIISDGPVTLSEGVKTEEDHTGEVN